MKKTLTIIPLAIAALLFGGATLAEEHSGHDTGHGDMAMNTNEAVAAGMINSIDAEKKAVNITHEAIPSINWPAMTMDLPTTKRVDLSKFKPGDKVRFTLKRGRDDTYRITAMDVVMGDAMNGAVNGAMDHGMQHEH